MKYFTTCTTLDELKKMLDIFGYPIIIGLSDIQKLKERREHRVAKTHQG